MPKIRREDMPSGSARLECELKLGCDFWGIDGSAQMILEGRKEFGSTPRVHFSVGTRHCHFPLACLTSSCA